MLDSTVIHLQDDDNQSSVWGSVHEVDHGLNIASANLYLDKIVGSEIRYYEDLTERLIKMFKCDVLIMTVVAFCKLQILIYLLKLSWVLGVVCKRWSRKIRKTNDHVKLLVHLVHVH